MFDKFEAQYASYRVFHLQVNWPRQIRGGKAEEISVTQGEKIDDQADEVIKPKFMIINAQLEKDQTDMDSMYSSVLFTMIVVIFIAIVAGVAVAALLLRDVTSSLNMANRCN